MSQKNVKINALVNKQWLESWDEVKWDKSQFRSKPPKQMYVFSIPASTLRKLSGINRRSPKQKGVLDLGVQRRHDEERSEEIKEYVKWGYPWSELSQSKRESGEFDDLRKPGWLPTAVIVNILGGQDQRRGRRVKANELITVKELGHGLAELILPIEKLHLKWEPSDLAPIEIIDGQHRLWAFDSEIDNGDFDIPVVAFFELDLSWQAYLFWTINIRPKRINQSFAFDLYPLLRTEDWLDKFEGHSIYRETRSQELTEKLWSVSESPWKSKINMLGETGNPNVSQAAWVRTLMATFVKNWESKGKTKIGGLFGAPINGDALPWTRSQQAAFLVFSWSVFFECIKKTDHDWANSLRTNDLVEDLNSEFYGRYSLINSDQGVRGFMHALNDICYLAASEFELAGWSSDKIEDKNDEEIISGLIKKLHKQPLYELVKEYCNALTSFDWRSSTAPGLSEKERKEKLIYKGSGGYKELRKSILEHVKVESKLLGKYAQQAADASK